MAGVNKGKRDSLVQLAPQIGKSKYKADEKVQS